MFEINEKKKRLNKSHLNTIVATKTQNKKSNLKKENIYNNNNNNNNK